MSEQQEQDQGWTKNGQRQEPEPKGEGPMSNEQAPRAVKFWECCTDAEHLAYTDIGEAVHAWADARHPEPLPETVTVHGYAPMELPTEEWIADLILRETLERLDEEHARFDGEDTTPTAAMKAASYAFARVIRREYVSWQCEEVVAVTVRVADHVPAEWMRPERAPVPAVDPSRSTPDAEMTSAVDLNADRIRAMGGEYGRPATD
jgi:hypothetical protein